MGTLKHDLGEGYGAGGNPGSGGGKVLHVLYTYGDGLIPNRGDGDGYGRTNSGDGCGNGWDCPLLLCTDTTHPTARAINLVARMQPP